MMFIDKINERIKSLIKKALDDKTSYKWEVLIHQYDNELCILPRVKRSEEYNWKTGCDWFNSNRHVVTNIINDATNMVWRQPIRPYEFDWSLKKGCICWSYSDGIPGGDGTTITGKMEKEIDIFLLFEAGEFQKTVAFVNGVRDYSIELGDYDTDNWEFCEEACI